MKSLTQVAQAESARRGQDVAWALTVEWPDGAVRYAHRRAALADAVLPATLAEPGTLTASRETGPGPDARAAESRLRISLLLDGTESPTVRERIASCDPEGLPATWGLIFLDEDGQAATTDMVSLFWGVIERAVVGRGVLEIECGDVLTARGRGLFGRELTGADLPEPGTSEGLMLPWVFGTPGQIELLEWRTGQPLVLVEDVNPDDTVIPLASIEGLPESGIVQIGDERVPYDALDPAAKTLGSDRVPLRRTEPAWHDAGSPARLAPTGGFAWLAAAHPCRAVRDLRADGLPVNTGLYAVATESWRGETVQKVLLAKWPTQITYRPYTHTVGLNGEAQPGVFALDPSSTALDGFLALDAFPESTKAELNSQARTLIANWCGDLSGGAKRYGLAQSARLIARVSADRYWEVTTLLRLTFQKGDLSADAVLPRPDPETLAATLPSHTHGDEGEPSGELTAETWYGPVDLSVDLTPLLEANGGWEMFGGGEEGNFLAKVEMETTGDEARFFVHDLALEVDYRPRGRTTMARRLSAEVEGLENDGVLLENPADLVRFFLCDSRAFGLDETHLDEASFLDAHNRLDALSYRFSNRLSEPRELSAILRRLLFEARCRLAASGEKLLLRFDPGEAELVDPDFTFDGNTVLAKDPLRLERTTERYLLRAVHLHYGRDFSGETPGGAARRFLWSDSVLPRPVYARTGVELTDRLHWHNHGNPAVAADLARALLDGHGFRLELARVAAPLCAAAVEPADRAALEDAWFPLNLDQGRVEAVTVREPHALVFHAVFPVGGPVCWRHDDRTFLRHRSSGRLLEFWIEGKLVASTQWDGLWRLRGRVTEGVTFYGAMEEAIVFNVSENRLYFGTGSAGSFTPRFAVDAAGNLLVSGAIAEETPREDLVLADCIEAAAGYFAKGIAETRPVFVYDVASLTLQTLGAVAEEERFY